MTNHDSSNPIDFTQSLRVVLDRLGRPAWFSPLATLASHFDELPLDDITFHAELLDMLSTVIQTVELDPNMPLSALVAIRLSKLTAWSVRVQYKDATGTHVTWNPTLESYTEFCKQAPETGHKVFQSAHAHPAEDLIKRWAIDHLR